ncbi:RING-H2 finger protein ATL46 [Capsicum annuum]|uniref:RING-H2 finger protein ATL46 n=1 Tax=Capsicum annuum TaxID=4072 RepID=UPI0007BF2600|nr:RING-H2 finger protein ATL46 [Capsicum annuum]
MHFYQLCLLSILHLSEFEKPVLLRRSNCHQLLSMSRISPILLLAIVIIAIVFFIFGLLHLLFRYCLKMPSFSSISQSNRFPESSGPQVLQRQLQQLFRQHDSGLDQTIIDTLPVFCYKDIRGLKEPFDCAVCLCEFSEHDKLRLLPFCSHAFHIDCIDTWLLSNSTCPLCRGIITSGISFGNPLFSSIESRGQWSFHLEDRIAKTQKSENVGETRVFSVRLGKFKNLNEGGVNHEDKSTRGEISSCNLDARRCFSMGSFQYVVGDSELQIALPDVKIQKTKCENTNFETNAEGKKISARTKGESFSVSKIWLWSKKGKFSTTSETNVGGPSLNLDIHD